MGEIDGWRDGEPVVQTRGPSIDYVVYDEAANWDARQFAARIREVAEAYEVAPIRLSGRRAGKTLAAFESLREAHERGRLRWGDQPYPTVVVPHALHLYAEATDYPGYGELWICSDCRSPRPVPLELPELAPDRVDCGWKPQLLPEPSDKD